MDHDPELALAPSRAIWLQETLFADVRKLLTAELGGIGPAFALVDLDDGGLRGAAVDAATGQCLIELNDNTLHSASFDRAMADHLVRTGRARMPATPEWARELIGMMAQARTLLGTTEATFVMGKQDVGLLRVTRADVEAALNPSTVRAISVARSVALASPSPICAVVVMSHHVEWPGLTDEMSKAFAGQLPVLSIRASLTPVRQGKHSRGSDSSERRGFPFPVPAYVPETRTEPTPMPVQSAAKTRSATVLGKAESGKAESEKAEPATESPKTTVSDLLPDPLPEPFPGPIIEPPPVPDVRAADRRRKQNRFVMAAAAAIAAVIVAGGITAAVGPWREDAAGLESQRYLTAPTSSGSTAATSTSALPVTPTNPPINTRAALAPIVSYTTPPPPPPTTRRTTQRPRQNPIPNPLPNTIPNPIPGQPPIVLP
ncbi:hypothetical protein [Williamsia sp.]|uniref:hypothetical protein n=1 Tax=Williamsia sp. TaxID=1872085 RepID=UPI002F929204